MRIDISLEYFTSIGEKLFLTLSGGETLPMEYAGEGRWKVSFEVPAMTQALEYSFEVHCDGNCARREWERHRVSGLAVCGCGEESEGAKASTDPSAGELCPPSDSVLVIRDRWLDLPEDLPFWTKAFTGVILRGGAPAFRRAGNLTLTVPFARLRKDEIIAVTGTIFDNWTRFEPLSVSAPHFWSLSLDASTPFEFKFVILDASTGRVKYWESGQNHLLSEIPPEGERLEIRDMVPEFGIKPWRGAGTAIPVFSLRGETSFGVGEFKDIKRLVDWAAMTGQSIIQLLPVNDTTMTGTWMDSYPYNANSTFALHPQFIHLPDAGAKADENYKALQQELNALPEVDYERVNNEKTHLLRKAFSAVGQSVILSRAFKKFCADNEGWLIPYSAFSVLRDINGTPEFSKWGAFSEYSEAKVMSFCRRHKSETDFYRFVQFCLDTQLKEAVEYAHTKGIAIKGDLPIGVSRTSVDAWRYPNLFNLDSQAGAPPDAFAADGQNWGFPTYNWNEMAKDDYAWWKARLKKMSEYFDAFRIDHILGFFRIWEIPVGVKSGLRGHFNPALPYPEDELRDRGFNPDSQLFVPDPHRNGWFHPRISCQDTPDYAALDAPLKADYDNLYNDFFYHRHNGFWKECAMKKLPALLGCTGMLACGEDLGMIPACVPEVMKELNILSLEIQRMPKPPGRLFDDPASYPYLSVCATGTHDTSTLRGWWEEDREMSERFFHEILRCEGSAPYSCEPWICERIVSQHLNSPSMLCVLPLQDWMSIDGLVRYQGNPEDERINIPAFPRHYWRWRMSVTLENLLTRTDFNRNLRDLIMESGRG